MDLSDDEIRRAGAGDRIAQESVYRHLSVRLGHLISRMVGASDADDVTQEVFVSLFQNLKSFKFESKFETWAYRLAVNEALQHLRRIRRKRTVPLDDETGQRPVELSGVTKTLETRELLEMAFSQMDPELRLVLQLKEIDQLPYDVIAEIVHVPVGTVGSRLNRARRELREQLKLLGWEG